MGIVCIVGIDDFTHTLSDDWACKCVGDKQFQIFALQNSYLILNGDDILLEELLTFVK